MGELSTKQKIIQAAIHLFNEHGVVNVRLQQIADKIGISVGNLAYHFKNKEILIETIHETLYEQISEVLQWYRVYPNLMDFDQQLTKYFLLLQKFPFYFLDLQEIKRNYPNIHTQRKPLINKMISQIRKRFDFNIQRGLIVKEPRVGIYDSISNAIWVLMTFWTPRYLEDENGTIVSEKKFKAEIWHQMYPYFTEKGIAEFEQLIEPLLKYPSSEK